MFSGVITNWGLCSLILSMYIRAKTKLSCEPWAYSSNLSKYFLIEIFGGFLQLKIEGIGWKHFPVSVMSSDRMTAMMFMMVLVGFWKYWKVSGRSSIINALWEQTVDIGKNPMFEWWMEIYICVLENIS